MWSGFYLTMRIYNFSGTSVGEFSKTTRVHFFTPNLFSRGNHG